MPIFPQVVSRMRHKWFPAVVVASAVTWWLCQALYTRYHTLADPIVLFISFVAIAIWYLVFGGGARRQRCVIVALAATGVLAFFVAFRPVYNGDMGVFRWRLRFAKSADHSIDQLDADSVVIDWKETPRDYPRFLGNGYWAEVQDVELEADWHAYPPEELWRREIGAGWSAFAIVGDYAVTQEQRGENELVACYRLQTGQPVWTHSDAARFDPADAIGGLGDIGPRATPTIHGGRIFTQGGTGVVHCLDARTGQVLWSHETAKEFGTVVTTWGKAGSPLIVDDTVVISVGAPTGAWNSGAEKTGPGTEPAARAKDFNSSLVAFDITTGAVRWEAGTRQASYASPVLATLAAERQIIVVNESWVTGHRASDGNVLWEYPWSEEHDRSASCSQPVPLENDRLFLSKGYGVGCSLLSLKRDAAGALSITPLWRPPIKKVMKTKFSNVVIRDGYVYGLDDVLLECIELETGAVKWKKRRNRVFGHGQIMLIGNTILIMSETGELVLVEATPTAYRELASMQALDESNVTWNNPAFAAPFVLVRNNREVACYRLPVK